MKPHQFLLAAALVIYALQPIVFSQTEGRPRMHSAGSEPDLKLPNGKSQQEEILKADHQKSLKDAAQLLELAEQLKIDLEKSEGRVLSVSTLKKTEEIEKLAKRIRSRLRRF